ncbi:MAG: hypothetical protein P8P87_07195 [Crocinitomicaceae bacterium]|nr:hypothetical protein [Crocinitomicaceae bacterium]
MRSFPFILFTAMMSACNSQTSQKYAEEKRAATDTREIDPSVIDTKDLGLVLTPNGSYRATKSKSSEIKVNDTD